MRAFLKLLGFALLLLGIYFLGRNIILTTNVYPYWWRGIAANASVFTLIAGVLMLIFLPRSNRDLGWVAVAIGVVLVFVSSRAILNPTSLWQFFLAFASIAAGYRMLVTGRSPF